MYFTKEYGRLMSENYPNEYLSSTNQLYKIRVPTGNRIRITVDSFATEAEHDVLRIVEGHFIDLNRGRPMARFRAFFMNKI